MDDSNEELSVHSSLLDFFSNRAIAHASFVVAGIFGIYSVLAIMNGNPWFLVPYVALLIIDVYSFLNFGLYAEFADIERKKILALVRKNLAITAEDRRDLSLFSKKFYDFRNRVRGLHKNIVLFVLWFVAVAIPPIIMLLK